MTEQIANIAGRLLRDRGFTLAVAESCTGGLVGHRVTQVPGSSGYFLGGVIAYSNHAKAGILGVSGSTLREYGAVSRQAAAEMARGARRAFRADIAVATTGIAGPSGGSRAKPVGLVYLGLAHRGGTIVRRHLFRGSRHAVKSQAADAALSMLREHLERRRQGSAPVSVGRRVGHCRGERE